MKTCMALFILLLAFTHSAADKASNQYLTKSAVTRTNKTADSRAMRTRLILQAVNAVTTIAEMHDKDYQKKFSRALTKEMLTKLSIAIDQFHNATDLMVLAKCFDGLRQSCGEESDANYLDVFDEAYVHCLRRLSRNDSTMAGLYLKDLNSNPHNGEEMLYIRKLIAEHAKREEASTHK